MHGGGARMELGYLMPQQWLLIERVLVSLTVAAGLEVHAALALLLGRGVIPSLVGGAVGEQGSSSRKL